MCDSSLISQQLGIGGLGHLAIQFAAKSGYNVVALSQSDSKKDLAMKLGAHHYLSGNDVVRGALMKSSMFACSPSVYPWIV